MKNISIIVPAYNEGDHIVNNLISVAHAVHDYRHNVQTIVVDDGSTDGTADRLYKYFYGVRGYTLLRNRVNLGKGGAIKAGIAHATGDYIVFIDADLEIAPTQIRLMLDIMDVSGADAVIGSKLHACSVVKYPFSRRVLSLGYFIFIKALFGLRCRDTQTGLKLFKAKALKKSLFSTEGFIFDLELLVNLYRNGYKIVEAPIILRTYTKYVSKKARIGPRIIWRMFRDTIKLWIKLKDASA